jgi:hypothetical protein
MGSHLLLVVASSRIGLLLSSRIGNDHHPQVIKDPTPTTTMANSCDHLQMAALSSVILATRCSKSQHLLPLVKATHLTAMTMMCSGKMHHLPLVLGSYLVIRHRDKNHHLIVKVIYLMMTI